ncbi:glycosyltransferase [Oscillatoria sp. FACHB-1406]|uniref:glycosyltransferase family 2 protein n=1 Tax=Oscillatoria sp. FACHB-1406 TaxID=2692846 RepID=UPI0016849F35|nr:glycosyltransferase [Oscillatoria sp. FACHB-1406]MBD2578576.1 glycosyltransferase [Oscillatoria sp. FACHB-1406]
MSGRSQSLPAISLIVPVYNGGDNFQRCLTSIASGVSPSTEVIVVGDGDTDGSWEKAQLFGFEGIRLPESRGPATARNIGAKQAKNEILFFVDADVEIYPDTLTKIAAVFESDPQLAALIGSYDDAPGAANFLSQYKNLFHHYTHQISSEEASTFWGACGAIRRDIFLEMGGFDESYRLPCVEDIELGYRLKKAGYRIQLCKEIQVKHLKRWGIISLLRADFFYRALPWTALILRDRALSNDLNLQYSSRLSVVAIYLLSVSLIASVKYPIALCLVVLASLALLFLNVSVYQFFYHKRGLSFTLGTIFWHWLYYFYSGLAFAIGNMRYQLQSFKQAMAHFTRKSKPSAPC